MPARAGGGRDNRCDGVARARNGTGSAWELSPEPYAARCHLPPAVPRGLHLRGRARPRGLPRHPRHLARLRLELPEGGAGQPARLRRGRPHAAQSRNRRRAGLRGLGRRPARPRDGPHHRPRAEPHGHRHGGQSVVAGRARERSQLAARGRLRHRLDPAQAGAPPEGAAAGPGRRLRRRPRAPGDPARVRDGAFRARYYDHVFPIAPGTYNRILALDHQRCSRRSAPRARTASSSSAS
jgi:hypothetical protein